MKALAYLILALAIFSYGCKSVARFPLEDPLATSMEDRIIGKWKFLEDTDQRNFYEVAKASIGGPNSYHVKFWNRGGTNPTYEANIFFSKLGNNRFINVPYWEGHFDHKGFFFLRILDVSADFSKMTTATVLDTTLWTLDGKEHVRERIMKNVANPAYYYDTIHFYKVK